MGSTVAGQDGGTSQRRALWIKLGHQLAAAIALCFDRVMIETKLHDLGIALASSSTRDEDSWRSALLI